VGVVISSAGLIALTYGAIKAGQNGWSDTTAVTMMAGGVVLLAAFAAWERAVGRRPSGPPDTAAAHAGKAGRAVGLGIGQRLLTPRKAPGGGPSGAPPVSAKVVAASGFAIMAVALAIGAGTSVRSGTGFAAAWFGVTGLGLGFAMPTALNAALGALSPERSGSGSAVITAMRQVGGTVGVAVLGTILASAYRAHLTMAGLPAAAAAAVHASVAGGIAVARAAG